MGVVQSIGFVTSTQMNRRLPVRSVSRSVRLLVPMKEAILGSGSALRL